MSPRTTGILGVHIWGQACDVLALADVARRHCLRLLFDAAHALGSTYGGVRLGRFGDAEIFSFHATKICNSFEGGMIATNDDGLAARCRRLRNFGFSDGGDVTGPGTNGKMSEINAAMGLTSLESWDDFALQNRRNFDCYREELSDITGIRILADRANGESNHQYVVVEIGEDSRIDRDTLLDVLRAEGVLARRYFWPGCHKIEPYRDREPNIGLDLPNTEAVACRVLSLPTGTAIGPAEIRTVAEIVRFAAERGREIVERRSYVEVGG